MFDGQSLAGWVTAKGEPINDGWEVVDGALHLKGRSQSIYSAREYTNFILDFESQKSRQISENDLLPPVELGKNDF